MEIIEKYSTKSNEIPGHGKYPITALLKEMQITLGIINTVIFQPSFRDQLIGSQVCNH